MGISFVTTYWWLSLIIIIVGVIFISTHYGFEIDLEDNIYKDYVWFLGYKNGIREPYKNINYFYITNTNYTQTYGPTAVRYQSSGTSYTGYLKLDENNNIFLVESNSKQEVVNKLRMFSEHLRIEIKDATEIE